jgi:putative membrane protein
MTLRWLLAALHLLALGIGLGAVFARGRALRGPLHDGGFQRVFLADNLWGLAGLLWIGTGLVRAFGGFEKGTAYYVGSTVFWIKMGLLAMLLVMEVWAAIQLVRWRRQRQAGRAVDTSVAPALARISDAQVVLVVLMLLAATAMARGLDL